MTPEEQQIFELLGALSKDTHPNAHACFVKLTLQLQDGPAPVPSPFDDLQQAALYIQKLSRVSAKCLSLKQELSLMDICDAMIESARVSETESGISDNGILMLRNYRRFLRLREKYGSGASLGDEVLRAQPQGRELRHRERPRRELLYPHRGQGAAGSDPGHVEELPG